jgi:LacI family transcriptional regulator
LRRKSSEVIALIIPDIENPFFTSLARGVEDRAQAAGFCVVLGNSDEQQDKENDYLDVVLAEHMAGVVLAPATDHPRLKTVLAAKIPVVAVDRAARGQRIDAVLVDNHEDGRAAANLLYAKGFRRVACITGPLGVQTADLRADGWREVFTARQRRAPAERYLRRADYRVAGGHDAMRSLLALRTPPDAVVVSNNLMAVGALTALREHGLSAPEFGLACLGDLPHASLTAAGVDVIPLPARQLGEAAADLLLSRIGGSTQRPQTLIVPGGEPVSVPRRRRVDV